MLGRSDVSLAYVFIFLSCCCFICTNGESSVGKTSIIQELQNDGEAVIHEAATDWIASRLANGISEFWKEEHLGFNILKIQLET